MANNTATFELAFGLDDLASMSDTSINLELKFSNSMAHENIKQTFILGHDPVQGFSVHHRCQPVPFDVNRHLHPLIAPLQGSQEPPVEPRTAAAPLRDFDNSTQAADNDPDQTDDEEWSNDIASTLVPKRRGNLPAPAPLVPGHPHARTALKANIQRTLAPASQGRADATVAKTRLDKFDNPSSSASHPVSMQTPDNDPGEKTEEDDWKANGVTALLQAAYSNQPHMVPERPDAPTAPKANTQGSKAHDQRASTGLSRKSRGRGVQKKRRRDVDAAPGRPINLKKKKG